MSLSDRQLKNRFARYTDEMIAAEISVLATDAYRVKTGKNKGQFTVKAACRYTELHNEQLRRKYGAVNYTDEQYYAVYNVDGSLKASA